MEVSKNTDKSNSFEINHLISPELNGGQDIE